MGRFEPLPAGAPPEGTLLVRPTRTPNRWFELRSVPLGRGSHSEGRILVLRDVTNSEEHRADRRAYLSILSHELRTPITTIYGLSKMLRQRGGSLDGTVVAKALEDIEGEADRLQRLVEDLLVLSRAERGKVEVDGEPIGIPRLVRRVAEAERQRSGRTIDVSIESGLPLAVGEETYVEQVVRNLLTNAAKYSDEGRPIAIGVVEEGEEVVVRVVDEGIGIAGADAARAFELFFRSKSATRMASGAGIGLFVCRQLVEGMGGRIWARSRDGRGAEFGFWLPALGEDDDG
jgi:signal transduction histidine kinase